MTLLSNLVSDKRQQKNMTQQDLSLATGINRALISRLEESAEEFLLRNPKTVTEVFRQIQNQKMYLLTSHSKKYGLSACGAATVHKVQTDMEICC